LRSRGAVLFAITGCGTTGAGSVPGSPGLGALPGGFAHTGMPFAFFTGARSHRPRRAVRQNYATNASLVFEADQDEASVNVYQTSDLSGDPIHLALQSISMARFTSATILRRSRNIKRARRRPTKALPVRG
jgi:hypothetical protein